MPWRRLHGCGKMCFEDASHARGLRRCGTAVRAKPTQIDLLLYRYALPLVVSSVFLLIKTIFDYYWLI